MERAYHEGMQAFCQACDASLVVLTHRTMPRSNGIHR